MIVNLLIYFETKLLWTSECIMFRHVFPLSPRSLFLLLLSCSSSATVFTDGGKTFCKGMTATLRTGEWILRVNIAGEYSTFQPSQYQLVLVSMDADCHLTVIVLKFVCDSCVVVVELRFIMVIYCVVIIDSIPIPGLLYITSSFYFFSYYQRDCKKRFIYIRKIWKCVILYQYAMYRLSQLTGNLWLPVALTWNLW